MSETHLDQNEIVHLDEDGLGFTRADFPSADYPVGTTIGLVGLPAVRGTVVTASEVPTSPGVIDPADWVPVHLDPATVFDQMVIRSWIHVNGVRLVSE